jgi:hypothetical protein
VSWSKAAGKWVAQIQKDKKNIYLGLYDTPEGAHQAYLESAKNLHLQFARNA